MVVCMCMTIIRPLEEATRYTRGALEYYHACYIVWYAIADGAEEMRV